MSRKETKKTKKEEGQKTQGKRSFWRKAWDFVKDWSTIILLVLAIRAFGVESMIVPTGSMERTIMPGDALLVNKFRYGFKMPFTNKDIIPGRRPNKGDVIVFRYPHHGRYPQPDERFVRFFPKWFPLLPIHWDKRDKKFNFYAPENWVKRCVGLPGDTVEIINKELYVNGRTFAWNYKAAFEDQYAFPRLVPREEFQKRWMDLLCFQFHDSLYYADSSVYKSNPSFGRISFDELRFYYDSLFVQAYYDRRIGEEHLMHYIVNFYMNPKHLKDMENQSLDIDLPIPPDGTADLAGFYNKYYSQTNYKVRNMEVDSFLYASYIMHYYMRDNFGPIVVPDGVVMGIGDNRDYSHDCRYWGFIPLEMLKGSPLVCYYSLGDEYDADSNKMSIPARILGTHWERIGRPVN